MKRLLLMLAALTLVSGAAFAEECCKTKGDCCKTAVCCEGKTDCCTQKDQCPGCCKA